MIIIYNREKILQQSQMVPKIAQSSGPYLTSGSQKLFAAAHNFSERRSELLMFLPCPRHPISLERRSHFMGKNCAVHWPSNLVMQGLWMAVFY